MLGLQRQAGNRAVVIALKAKGKGTGGQRQASPQQPPDHEIESVRTAIEEGRILDGERPVPEGLQGPPAPGGAFWRLNGMSPQSLMKVLRAIGREKRQLLLSHVDATAGTYDTPRLEAALRAASWQDQAGGTAGLGLLDAIRANAGKPFGPVWALLDGQSRVAIIAALRVLPREALGTLRDQLEAAPAERRQLYREVVTDLLGSGTDMAAEDVIDLEGLRGLQRMMAEIYNQRGQLLAEQAAALGIGTAAAAGIMKAESGGATYDPGTNLTIVRFENHWLWKLWGKKSKANTALFNDHFTFQKGSTWLGHRWRPDAKGQWQGFHGNQAEEWRVLQFAAGLAGDVAYECASFGAGQIMGYNHAQVGYTSGKQMADAFNPSERAQVTGIFEFIRANKLAAAINRGDYLTLATLYNGGGKAAEYAGVIKQAADVYAAVTKGHTHVR